MAASAAPAFAAKPPAPPPLQVSYPGDAAMSCDQLYTEVGTMDIIMGKSTDAAAKAQGSARAAELGASVGINAALYSGVLGRVPGVGLFANAAAAAAKAKAAAEQKKQQERLRTAEMRRTMLMGIYQGKGCGAPAAAPAATVAAVPPAATSTPATASGSANPAVGVSGQVAAPVQPSASAGVTATTEAAPAQPATAPATPQ